MTDSPKHHKTLMSHDAARHTTVPLDVPHHRKPKARHEHRRLHPHHRSMHYLAAAGMTALGLLLIIAFNPVTSSIIQPPAGSLSEDVAKIMPTLEPDLGGFNDAGITADQLDETALSQ